MNEEQEPSPSHRLLESVTNAATAPLGLASFTQQQQQQHPQQQQQQQQPLSRGRFLVDRCTGICSLIITCGFVILIFLTKNEGVNNSVSELASFIKELVVNSTLSSIKKNLV